MGSGDRTASPGVSSFGTSNVWAGQLFVMGPVLGTVDVYSIPGPHLLAAGGIPLVVTVSKSVDIAQGAKSPPVGKLWLRPLRISCLGWAITSLKRVLLSRERGGQRCLTVCLLELDVCCVPRTMYLSFSNLYLPVVLEAGNMVPILLAKELRFGEV